MSSDPASGSGCCGGVVIIRQRALGESLLRVFQERIEGLSFCWVPAAVHMNTVKFENPRLILYFADGTEDAIKLKLHIIQCTKPDVPKALIVDRPRRRDREILGRYPCQGYFSLSDGLDKLVESVKLLLAGQMVISSFDGLTYPDFNSFGDENDAVDENDLRISAVLSSLTAREAAIFECLTQGMDENQCAEVLNITEKTILNIKSRINKKLGLKGTVDMLRLAIRLGLI